MVTEDTLQPGLPEGFPDGTFPNIYADGVWSISWGNGVVKFYLHRSEPSFSGMGSAKQVPVAQIVMPIAAFSLVAAFFQAQLGAMLGENVISNELVAEHRAVFHDEQGRAGGTR